MVAYHVERGDICYRKILIYCAEQLLIATILHNYKTFLQK